MIYLTLSLYRKDVAVTRHDMPTGGTRFPIRTRYDGRGATDEVRGRGATSLDKSLFSEAAQTPASALVKPSGSSFEGLRNRFEPEIGDIEFRNLRENRPSGHTSPLVSPGHTSELHNGKAYPLTNGIAGGKLPRGNLGSGSPRWSFSAAVR